jgi:hypothetical protein
MILVAPEFGVAIAFDGYFQAKGAVLAQGLNYSRLTKC